MKTSWLGHCDHCFRAVPAPDDNYRDTGLCPRCWLDRRAFKLREGLPVGGTVPKVSLPVPLHVGFVGVEETEAHRWLLELTREKLDVIALGEAGSRIFDDGSRVPRPIDLTAYKVAPPPREKHHATP